MPALYSHEDTYNRMLTECGKGFQDMQAGASVATFRAMNQKLSGDSITGSSVSQHDKIEQMLCALDAPLGLGGSGASSGADGTMRPPESSASASASPMKEEPSTAPKPTPKKDLAKLRMDKAAAWSRELDQLKVKVIAQVQAATSARKDAAPSEDADFLKLLSERERMVRMWLGGEFDTTPSALCVDPWEGGPVEQKSSGLVTRDPPQLPRGQSRRPRIIAHRGSCGP